MANKIKIGNSDITLKLGSADVSAAYLGSTLVYSGGTQPTQKDYLRTIARGYGDISLTIGRAVATSSMTSISYSLDSGETWVTSANTNSSTVTLTTPSLSSGDIVYWKGEGVQLATNTNTYTYTNFSATTNYDVEGNIMSLLAGDNFENAVLESGYTYHFANLFRNDSHVINASGLTIPSMKMYGNDCNNMFANCANLVTTPSVLAPTEYNSGEDGFFKRMFSGCTSLTTTPILSSTTLAPQCYSNMFVGCTSLTTAPQLPAETMEERCYEYMFSGCTSLTTAPELPATTLATYCYQYMFRNCTSLTTAPELPATTLANNCYSDMFQDCTSLTTVPELPATTLADYCYSSMFHSCTSLTTAPELPATTLVQRCYYYMFRGCTSLTTAPELPATTLAVYCYGYMFMGCTSLTTAPELPATTLRTSCYDDMFKDCTSLNYIKAMFTTTPSSEYTHNWVLNVASSGTFVKNSSATWNVTGSNGIPSGWSIEYAT